MAGESAAPDRRVRLNSRRFSAEKSARRQAISGAAERFNVVDGGQIPGSTFGERHSTLEINIPERTARL